jgi:hypothetical protein
MGMIDILKDDFTAGTLMEQFAGNGSFNFPGTTAELICPNSQNCNWDYQNGPYAPVLWGPEGIRSEGGAPARFEAKMNSFIRTTTSSLAGIVVFPEIGLPQSMYYMAYYANESRIIIDRQYGTGASRIYSSGAVPDPSGTPHFYRVYSNKSDRSLYVPETDTALSPNTIGFAFSTDGGSTWTMAHTRTIDIYYFRVGVFARKWAAGASDNATATFEYFYAEQYDEANVKDGAFSVSAKEGIEFPPLTGEIARGSADIERASVISTGAQIGAVEEREFRPSGGEPSHRGPGLEHGQPLMAGGQVGALEDIDLQLDEGPTYMPDKNDLDGQELLQGRRTRTLNAGDLTGDRWDSPPSGFYGTGRDGKNYYDGEECTPSGPQAASFGTVAGGPNRRCWSLWTNAPPMEWNNDVALALSIPVDGTVRIAGTALSNQSGFAASMWYLDGDFDIQVELSNWSESGGTDGGASFAVYADNDNTFYARRRISGGVAENGRWDKDVKVNGSWSNYAYADAGGGTATWFRLVRSGNNVSSYYGSPGSWTQIGTSFSMGRAEPMYVAMNVWGNGSPNISADFLNFSINSGTVINTVAWAREAEGTHRGTQDSFPAKYLWVSTNDSLNLMDAENDKLWMRFIEGNGQILGTGWGGTDQWVHDVAFSEGVALIAWHGAVIRVDFNLNDVRIGRLITDTNRGAGRLTSHGNGYVGWKVAGSPTNAHINTRNASYGFSTPSYDAWQVDSRDVNSVDLSHVFEYEYRAIASAAGLRMHKSRRWYVAGADEEGITTPDWSEWDQTENVLFCRMDTGDQEVFWIDDQEDMHSRARGAAGGWETAMDESTFAAGTTKALPGTRSHSQQYMFVRLDPYVFVPADEGVYRINWPSGSWELFYGVAGSGATHEVLPSYSHVTTLTLANDGSQNLLVVGMIDGVAVVDRDIHTIYGQTPSKRGHFTEAVAV